MFLIYSLLECTYFDTPKGAVEEGTIETQEVE